MAKMVDVEAVKAYRTLSAYYEKKGWSDLAETYAKCADKLDPPAIKCAGVGCHSNALFKLYAPPIVEDDTPARIGYRCEQHLISWLSLNSPCGTIQVDLL